MHTRLQPKKHSFWYNVYMFYIDLDEIDSLVNRLRWFSRNKFNLFSFRDKEHLQLPKEQPDLTKNTRQHINTFLADNGVDGSDLKIMLLTNLNVMGYNFNPVSFYYCFNKSGKAICTVIEITNTYKEMKLFFMGAEDKHGDVFKKIATKHFYVSPFIDHDMAFDFKLSVPDERLNIKIDDLDKDGKKFFISILTGERKPLNNSMMIKFFFSMPLIPLQVISLIYWQALKLWLKKLPYHEKNKNPEQQQDVYNPYKK